MNIRNILVLLTLVGVTSSHPQVETWSLNELYDAIQNLPKDSPIRSNAIKGANVVFDHIKDRHDEDFGHIFITSPSGAQVWTKDELVQAIDDIITSPVLGFYAQPALERLSEENTAPLLVPAVDISRWIASDIVQALEDPNTAPALLPYLKTAEKEIKDGKQKEVSLVTPVGLVSVKSGTHHYPGYLFQKIYI